MNAVLKRNVTAALFIALSAVVAGCGEKSETNVPAVKLTASALVSQVDATAHTHVVTVPFTDVSASPSAALYQYRSDVANGHSHVIALSKDQMTDLNNGRQLVLTSSSPDAGSDHTHTWSIQGGNVLYEKNCYNCHSNDKRGHSPMNVSFTPDQYNAVKAPAAMPLSTSAPALPDPAFNPSATVLLDGATLYASNCSGCHGALASSTKLNRSFAQIKNAITGNSGGMASLGSLTDAQIQAIATALVK